MGYEHDEKKDEERRKEAEVPSQVRTAKGKGKIVIGVSSLARSE